MSHQRTSRVLTALASAFTAMGVAAPALSQAVEPSEAGVLAYCQHVAAVASSNSAQLASPWLFSNVGTLRSTAGTPAGSVDDALQEQNLALRVGMGYSPTSGYLGGLVQDSARTECERHRANVALASLSKEPSNLERSGLTARIGVLRESLPQAGELLQQGHQSMAQGNISLSQYSALASRVQGLRRDLLDAEEKLAALPPPTLRGPQAQAAFDALRQAEAQHQAVQGKLRRAGAFEVRVRGGYQEVFGVEQRVPWFGSLDVQFVPGWLWQRTADEQAVSAHAELVESRIVEVSSLLRQRKHRLQAELSAAQKRLEEETVLMADLERRYEQAKDVGTALSREFREYLWFDLVRMRADVAQSSTRVHELSYEITRLSDLR